MFKAVATIGAVSALPTSLAKCTLLFPSTLEFYTSNSILASNYYNTSTIQIISQDTSTPTTITEHNFPGID
jgi:hypothetical protein